MPAVTEYLPTCARRAPPPSVGPLAPSPAPPGPRAAPLPPLGQAPAPVALACVAVCEDPEWIGYRGYSDPCGLHALAADLHWGWGGGSHGVAVTERRDTPFSQTKAADYLDDYSGFDLL